MINSRELLKMMSEKSAHDNPVPRNRFGYIDYSYDASKYPQVLPKVLFDGEELSTKGYTCVYPYTPFPGDKVVLMPVSTDYVIMGCVDRTPQSELQPGTLVAFVSRQSTTQSFTSGTWAAVVFDSDLTDNEGGSFMGVWSSETDPSRVTPNVPGVYLASGLGSFENNSTGWRGARIWVNSTEVASNTTRVASTNHVFSVPTPMVSAVMNGSTDYFELAQAQGSGATLATSTGVQRPSLRVWYMGGINRSAALNEIM